MSNPSRHCHKCGCDYTLNGQPGRSEACPQCSSDLHACLNCVSFDSRSAEQCRDRRADLVHDKHLANFCEYFDFIRRVFKGKDQPGSRELSARDQLKKLLGD